MPSRTRRRTTALAAAVATAAALGATALATAAAPPAAAAGVPLSGYELTWGIKQTYRTYVTTYASGSFTPAAGASQAADNGAFTFTEGSGTYDPTAHTIALGFQGSLKIESKQHGFEITLSDVRLDTADAEITADVTRAGTTTQDVPLADVTVTRAMKDMATTLTKEAADVFGSAHYAGAAGDPLTVVEKKKPEPEPTPTPTGSPTGSPSPSPTATRSPSPTPTGGTSPSGSPSPSPTATAPTGAPVKGDLSDGTLRWGVKESFRSYVVDGVAQGDITVSGGASQAAGNGVFTFPDATGAYDLDADTLTAEFQGAVNFKGHKSGGAYGLDLTLSEVRATLDGGSGELTADVTSLGKKTEDVVLADIKAPSADLTAKNDVISLSGITTKVTAAGEKAFTGFYKKGEALDPVALHGALTEGAELPDGEGDSGGSGGTGGSGTGSGGAGTTGSTSGGLTGDLAATGSDVPVAALGTAAALTVVAGAGVVLAVRKRRTQA